MLDLLIATLITFGYFTLGVLLIAGTITGLWVGLFMLFGKKIR